MSSPSSVLFACTLNAVRSPMAAALYMREAGPLVRVASAGVLAGLPDPYAAAVMDEIGIDICDHEPRCFRDLSDNAFDLVITLSPEAHRYAQEHFRGTVSHIEYWPAPEVSAIAATLPRQEAANLYRELRDQLLEKITAHLSADRTR